MEKKIEKTSTLEEAKNLLETIHEVIEESKSLEEVVEEKVSKEVEVIDETSVPTTEEAQAYVDELNKEAEDGKTLAESIYEETEEALKWEAQKNIDDVIAESNLPDVSLEEIAKEKEIEKVVEEITDIVDKKQTPEKVIEQLTEMFIDKEERLQTELKIANKKNAVLEEIVDKYTSEINRLKYGEGKVDIVDDFMWAFVTTYKESLNNPDDLNLRKKLWVLYISGAGKIYPELSMDNVTKFITDTRNANLNAIKGITEWGERDWTIKDTVETPKRSRPIWLVIG